MKSFSHAFTLIETLMVIGITSIMLLALTALIQDFYKSNAYVFEQTVAIDNARRSVDAAVDNLREASYAADGSYPIAAAATSTLTFYSDISGSTVLEKVHYYLNGSTLYRGTTVPAGNPPSYSGQPETATLVIANVRNTSSTPIFRYFSADGSELTAPINIPNISSVLITVLTDVNPYRAPLVYTLSIETTLRNLKTEL